MGMQQQRGRVAPTVVEGRLPRRADEVILGTRNLERAGLHIGDIAVLRLGNTAAGLRIVGRGLFPEFGDAGGLGNGVYVTFAGLQRMLPEARQNVFLLRYRAGTDAEARRSTSAARSIRSRRASSGEPREVQALSDVSGLPALLGALLALLAAATLAHTLISSVRRRRRRAGGAPHDGIRAPPGLAVGVLADRDAGRRSRWSIGIPLGALLGRLAWNVFAEDLGAIAEPQVAWSPFLLTIPAALPARRPGGDGARVARRTDAAERRPARRVRRQAVTSSSMRARVFSMFFTVWSRPAPRAACSDPPPGRCPRSRARGCRRRPARGRSARSGRRRAWRPTRPAAWSATRSAVLVELDDLVDHRVGDAHLHRHPELRAQRQPLGADLGVAHGAGAVDVAVAGGVGEQVEDLLGGGRDHPLGGGAVARFGHGGIVPATGGRMPAAGPDERNHHGPGDRRHPRHPEAGRRLQPRRSTPATAEAFAALFVDGGSLDTGFNVVKGTDELRGFADFVPTMAPGARHLVSNVSIDGDGDDATTRLYLQMWSTAGGAAETKLVISGVYEDTLAARRRHLAVRHPQDRGRQLSATGAPSATARVTNRRVRPMPGARSRTRRVRLEPLVAGRGEGELAAGVLEVDGAAPAVHARARHRGACRSSRRSSRSRATTAASRSCGSTTRSAGVPGAGRCRPGLGPERDAVAARRCQQAASAGRRRRWRPGTRG